MDSFLVILIATAIGVGIVALAIMVGKKKQKELIGEGKIIQREQYFWELAEDFATTATYERVVAALQGKDLSECGATAEYNVNGLKQILISSSYGWTASLSSLETKDGSSLYRLKFDNFSVQRYGAPTNPVSMNMIMTIVEKLFLELDPQTTVTSKRLNYQSH